ncbi:MAG: tRNA uracil 4-sulfurtransferase ThiI [Christensenellales bacterium]
MKKVILIRYGEIFLKGANRGFFENTLINNINKVLEGKKYVLTKYSARYVISDFDESETEWFIDKIACIFGIHSLSLAYEVNTDIDEIAQACKALTNKRGTFKVNTKRADKRFSMNSYEISSEIGYRLLTEFKDLTVDLHNPDQELYVDVRENGKTLVFSSIIKAVNGMPVGVSGKGLLMLSGGIDSPVACFMMAKRGMTLRALHFASYPYTSENAKQKVLTLAKLLKKYCINLTVDVVSFTEIQTQIHEKCPENLMITIMRRFMMRIANRMCDLHDCKAVITGESLGQVASQTMESITSTNSVAKYPVLRPLIGFDKDEIIEIARKINTFDTSILPYEDCCTIFLPKNPATKPKLEVVERAEKALDVDALVDHALKNVETYYI